MTTSSTQEKVKNPMKVKVYEPVDFVHPFSTAIDTLKIEQVYSNSITIESRK
jgi:hypothetical protein